MDPAALQRPISMAKLGAEHWSPASSEHELLVPRDAHQPGSSPAQPAGREGYAHLAAPPVLAESARPASPRHRADVYHYRPSVDQGAEHWYGRGDEHAEDGRNHHKKKGLFGFVVGSGGGGAKDKGAEREKDKPSDWTGFLRKKEPRIEYRGPEYTDHTTMTDASYAEVMPVAYAGVAQPVKVLEVPKKDRELAIREAQERTKEAQRAEKQRLKEEERRMKDEEKRAREEEKERARADKELAKRKEDGKAKARDPKSVSYEIGGCLGVRVQAVSDLFSRRRTLQHGLRGRPVQDLQHWRQALPVRQGRAQGSRPRDAQADQAWRDARGQGVCAQDLAVDRRL
jgi:hypothetical protein